MLAQHARVKVTVFTEHYWILISEPHTATRSLLFALGFSVHQCGQGQAMGNKGTVLL